MATAVTVFAAGAFLFRSLLIGAIAGALYATSVDGSAIRTAHCFVCIAIALFFIGVYRERKLRLNSVLSLGAIGYVSSLAASTLLLFSDRDAIVIQSMVPRAFDGGWRLAIGIVTLACSIGICVIKNAWLKPCLLLTASTGAVALCSIAQNPLFFTEFAVALRCLLIVSIGRLAFEHLIESARLNPNITSISPAS